MPILLGLLMALGLLIAWLGRHRRRGRARPRARPGRRRAAARRAWPPGCAAPAWRSPRGQFLAARRRRRPRPGRPRLAAHRLAGPGRRRRRWPARPCSSASTTACAAANARPALLDLEVAVGQLRGLIAAGLSLGAAVEELARRGPERLRPAFAGVRRAASLPGDGLAAGLATLRDALGPAADDLVEALIVAHRAGADALLPVLDQLAAALRGRREVEEAIAVAQHRTVLQARLLVGRAAGAAAGHAALSPSFTAVYDTPLGAAWLAGIAGLVGCRLLADAPRRAGAPPRRARAEGGHDAHASPPTCRSCSACCSRSASTWSP